MLFRRIALLSENDESLRLATIIGTLPIDLAACLENLSVDRAIDADDFAVELARKLDSKAAPTVEHVEQMLIALVALGLATTEDSPDLPERPALHTLEVVSTFGAVPHDERPAIGRLRVIGGWIYNWNNHQTFVRDDPRTEMSGTMNDVMKMIRRTMTTLGVSFPGGPKGEVRDFETIVGGRNTQSEDADEPAEDA